MNDNQQADGPELPTPPRLDEYEEYIRAVVASDNPGSFAPNIVRDLLAEVDHLRGQWDKLVYQRSEQADEVERLRVLADVPADQTAAAVARAREALAEVEARDQAQDDTTASEWQRAQDREQVAARDADAFTS